MRENGYYWYFAPKDRRLRYGDGRLIEVGETHTVEPPLELCAHGLHASRRVIDALQYTPGPIACRVRLSGEIIPADDKSCATERTYLSVVDAEDTLRAFARRCSLDVIDLWDAPDVVREYLETAAWAAARDATWDAARYAARAAAWDAARAAKTEEYNGWLEEMLLKAETE